MAYFDGLSAVEPERGIDFDFEVHEDDTGVVEFVDLVEAGVETTRERGARSVERGLSDCVVGRVEVKSNYVSNSCVELVGPIYQVAVSSYHHAMCSFCRGRCRATCGWRNASRVCGGIAHD